MHLLTTILTLTSLLATTLSAPTSMHLIQRAGAPIAQPIDKCSLTGVLPTFHLENSSFVPSDDFAYTNLLYSYLLKEEMPLEEILSGKDVLEYCMETCHGYGNLNECQSVFFDYSLEKVLCTLFSKPLAQTDLVKADVSGTDQMALAVDITCPASLPADTLPAPTSKPLVQRADITLHPTPKPIDKCTLTFVFPTFDFWGHGFVPSSDFVSTNLLYANLLETPLDDVHDNCTETCSTYGKPNECQSVFIEYTDRDAICALFSKPLAKSDLVKPETDTLSLAVNVTCPPPAPASLLTTTLMAPTLHLLAKRAGAPIPKSVENCTLVSVLHSSINLGLGSVPSAEFISTNILYSYVLAEDYQLRFSEEALLENCLMTCHGYGNLNECQSVYFAYLSSPNGTSGAALEGPEGEEAACLLFSKPLAETDMVAPWVNMTYWDAKVVDITCPDT